MGTLRRSFRSLHESPLRIGFLRVIGQRSLWWAVVAIRAYCRLDWLLFERYMNNASGFVIDPRCKRLRPKRRKLSRGSYPIVTGICGDDWDLICIDCLFDLERNPIGIKARRLPDDQDHVLRVSKTLLE